MGGVRDPYILAQMDGWLAQLDDSIKTRIHNTVGNQPYEIVTRVYGRDGVMGALEPLRNSVGGHEAFILWDVISGSQELSPHDRDQPVAHGGAQPDPQMERVDLGCRVPLFAARDRPRPGLRVPPQPRARAGQPDLAVPHRIRGGLTMATLGDLAKLVRSKNAGPFWLTIDIMFDDADAYRRARDAEIVNRAAIAKLYNRSPTEIIVVNHDTALAIKVSFPAPAKLRLKTRQRRLWRPANTHRFWGWKRRVGPTPPSCADPRASRPLGGWEAQVLTQRVAPVVLLEQATPLQFRHKQPHDVLIRARHALRPGQNRRRQARRTIPPSGRRPIWVPQKPVLRDGAAAANLHEVPHRRVLLAGELDHPFPKPMPGETGQFLIAERLIIALGTEIVVQHFGNQHQRIDRLGHASITARLAWAASSDSATIT